MQPNWKLRKFLVSLMLRFCRLSENNKFSISSTFTIICELLHPFAKSWSHVCIYLKGTVWGNLPRTSGLSFNFLLSLMTSIGPLSGSDSFSNFSWLKWSVVTRAGYSLTVFTFPLATLYILHIVLNALLPERWFCTITSMALNHSGIEVINSLYISPRNAATGEIVVMQAAVNRTLIERTRSWSWSRGTLPLLTPAADVSHT